MSQPENALTPEEADEALRKYECRKLTQDGWIWPVGRAAMRHGPTIRARMVEDFAKSFGLRDPEEGDFYLTMTGWPQGSIKTHGVRAIEEHFSKWGGLTPRRDFALIDEVKPGDFLVTDGGFTCLAAGSLRRVEADAEGHLFIRCAEGEHGLEGQVDNEERCLIGLFPFRTKT
jgi:hypothetical protein